MCYTLSTVIAILLNYSLTLNMHANFLQIDRAKCQNSIACSDASRVNDTLFRVGLTYICVYYLQ